MGELSILPNSDVADLEGGEAARPLTSLLQFLLRSYLIVLKRERPQEKLYSYVRHVISRARRVSLLQIIYASPD
jgi:hypothetical protein